jgi:hypothetical protein
VVIVVAGAVFFFVYTTLHRDRVSDDAASWAKTFIQSSPVVEQQLGHVQTVKEVKEHHQADKTPGWYLDYDVAGRRRARQVEMRLIPDVSGDFNVPQAELVRDPARPINLR